MPRETTRALFMGLRAAAMLLFMGKKTTLSRVPATTGWLVLLWMSCPALLFASAESDALRQELERLRQRIDELERRLSVPQDNTVDAREAAAEDVATPPAAEQALDIGGALRFNYVWKDFDDGSETRRGDAGLDLFRINVDGERNNILLSAEYRFYAFMDTIHHGWIGYDFETAGQLQAGITQVPFGLLPYAAHNFWFGIPYYIGLADDYDTGIKYVRDSGPWNLQLAVFKNAEFTDSAELDRYSYDPVTTGAARNEQTNTLHARLVYTARQGGDCTHEFGASALWGQLYNKDTDEDGDYRAAAAHLDSRCGRWNLQLEGGRYEYDPRNPAGVSDDSITFGAFGGVHEVAAEGSFGVANIAYNLPVTLSGVDLVTCYNDFSVLDKTRGGFENSYLNTTGCAVGIGPTFTYIDIIRGKNALFLGDGSLAGDGDNRWATRYNINIGYYW